MGLPVLRLSSSSMHAIAITPAESQTAFAHFACDNGLPLITGGSASALVFSRPAQRSLALWPACSPSSFTEPSTPKASAASLPLRLLQLLPAGAKVAGRDSHPLENSAFARRTVNFGEILILLCHISFQSHLRASGMGFLGLSSPIMPFADNVRQFFSRELSTRQ